MPASSPPEAPTGGAAARFFDELARRGTEPLLRKVSGRIRFDLTDGADTRTWTVAVNQGELRVVQEAGPADCTIRGDGAVFEDLASGRRNFMAAVVRGALTCYGDLQLLLAAQRIFPAPPRGWDPTAGTRSA